MSALATGSPSSCGMTEWWSFAETVDLRTLYGALKRAGKPVSIEQMNRDIAESVAESQSSRPR